MNIKPCPFCGKAARVIGGNCEEPYYWVECSDINCMANTLGQKTQEKAIELWNRRAYEGCRVEDDA